VEIEAGESPQVRIAQTIKANGPHRRSIRAELTNALPRSVQVEVKLGDIANGSPISPNAKLTRKDGAWLWSTNVPANGTAVLTYSFREE
jgi:hypothetical protein